MSTSKVNSPAEKLNQHLKSKWKNRPCPMCSAIKWSLPPMVFELQPFQSGAAAAKNGPLLPVIPITCEGCGLVQMVNAIIAGIVPASSSPAKSQQGRK